MKSELVLGMKYVTSVSGIEDLEYDPNVGVESEVFLHKISRTPSEEDFTTEDLLKWIHAEVDNKKTRLWTDHDPDESSTHLYVAFGNKQLLEIDNMHELVRYIYKPEYDLYMVVTECYC